MPGRRCRGASGREDSRNRNAPVKEARMIFRDTLIVVENFPLNCILTARRESGMNGLVVNDFDLTASERESLASIGRNIAGESSFEGLLDAVFPALGLLIPCDRLEVSLAEEGGQRLVTRHVVAGYRPLLIERGYTLDVDGSMYQSVFASRAPGAPVLKRVGDRDETAPVPLLLDEGILHCIIMPVLSGEAVIGAMTCGTREGGPYTDRHAGLLSEALKLLLQPIERTYHADQIEKHYQAYTEMLGFVAHELKSPLSSIITMTRTMFEGYYGAVDPQQRDILRRIIKKTEYLDALSSQYLNLSRFESSMMELKPQLVDLIEDVMDPVIELLLPQVEERAVDLQRYYQDTVYPVRCDPDLLRIVMMNLLSNAVKYGNRNGVVRVSITRSFKKYSVAVFNEGPGFTEQDRHRLFKKFSRIESKELVERRGSGIGLYLSWKIVRMHGGRITAESQHGLWARFIVEMSQHLDLCIVE